MKNENFSKRISRRDVMQAAGAAALLSAAALLGLREASAQARSTGKPLLSAARLDALLAQNPALLEEYAADPRRFLTKSFTLTSAQQKALDAFTRDEVAHVQSAVRFAASHKLPVKHECARTAPAAGQTVMARTSRLSIVAPEQTLARRGVPAQGSPSPAPVVIGAAL